MAHLMSTFCKATFSGAKHISTDTLQSYLDNDTEPLILLDVRRKDEFEVSHIKGAIWVGEDGSDVDLEKEIQARFQGQDKSCIRIICYCSVGYRSSKLAQALRNTMGYEEAVNLEGSLFKWANEGRQLWKGDIVVEPPKVHPYNKLWGMLLDKEKHSLV